MDSPKITYRYYSNPAFCAQSEVVFSQQAPCVSPRVHPSPHNPSLGAKSPRKPSPYDRNNHRLKTDISDNPLRIIHSGNGPLRYVKDEPPELPPKPPKFAHSRNNSVISTHSRNSSNTPTLQRQRSLIRTSKRSLNSSMRSRSKSEDLEMSSLRYQDISIENTESVHNGSIQNHRYEVIRDLDDLADYSPTKKRIVESETEEYNVDAPDDSEFKAIPAEIVKTVNGKTHRYAIVPSDEDELPKKTTVSFSTSTMSQKNLIATQKLHELLSTPPRRTLKSYGSQPSINMKSPAREAPRIYPITPSKRVSSTPKTAVTPSKSCANLTISPKSMTSPFNPKSMTSPISPRAQQKLNYGIIETEFERSPRQITVSPEFLARDYREKSQERSLDFERRDIHRSRDFDKRRSPKKLDKNTAIIQPRLAVQETPSVYSEETTYKSWSTLKTANATSASLAIAALMMTLCGGLTAGLSFYMMYSCGRPYYVDFSVLSGFTCLLLGLLGFRSRAYQLLPNRNYISGYIVLSVFSLLSGAGLLALLVMEPMPGTALNDITSGAVCALSVLSLFLSSLGVVTSYCCKRPPPDNRVSTWY